MKNKKLLIRYGHLKYDNLPANIKKQVDASPECSAYFKDTEQLVQLLNIKKHELPSEATEGRLLYNVESRLNALDGLTEQVDEEPSTPWGFARLGFAALFAGLLTLNIVYLKKVESPQSPVAVSSFGSQQTAKVTATNNFPIQPIYNAAEASPIMLVSSNNFPVDVGAPSGLQYINLSY